MNVKQAKILLEKINRLFQSMTMDEHISEIEKELMRNYIKQMYEEFMPNNTSASVPPIAPTVEKRYVAPPTVEKVEAPKIVAPPKVQRVETPPPPPPRIYVPPVETPVEEPTPEPVPTSAPVAKPKPAPVVGKVPEPVKVPPPVYVAPPKPVKAKISEEHEELFEEKEATELSEKLSQQPIKDLRKAMGINERILTTNELFDGNGDALKDALSTLNGLKTFDEAKEYLSNIAGIYNWTARKKKKKAQVFIKLIRRKFL